MIRFARLLATLALLLILPSVAYAVAGGRPERDPDGLRASVVQIESSRGELCSGALIAPDLVLTAAHCVLHPAAYRVVGVDRRFRRNSTRAVAAALHPSFVPGTTPRTQPGIDLAIIKLAAPLGPDFTPLDARAAPDMAEGAKVDLAGFGLTAENRRGSARVLRSTRLLTLGTIEAANRVVVVADEERLAETTGAGACRGDSGGPILLEGGRNRFLLAGIVSWSSGALHARQPTACGGLTAVTPVAEHQRWIAARASELGRVNPDGSIAPAPSGSLLDWLLN